MLDHNQLPQRAEELDPELLRKLKELQASPYFEYVKNLKDKVVGRMVERTEAGTSGFMLWLDDGTWVLCHLEGSEFRWKVGTGPMLPSDQSLVNSPACGDASSSLGQVVPYGDQPCNYAVEVSNAVGQQITGIAYGEGCFNFCFPNGRELDVTLQVDREGNPAYRVYWEQW